MLRSLLLVSLYALGLASAHAGGITATCHASSSYDITVRDGGWLLDRAGPAPARVSWQDGALATDGRAVALDAGQLARMTRFDQTLRQLLPRVRAVAQHGAELAAASLRRDVAAMDFSPATMAAFDQRLAAQLAHLEQRIATSRSSHDWQGQAATDYAHQVAAELLPPLMAELGQQAVTAAMAGDIQAAAALRDRASGLAGQLQAHLRHNLTALQPELQALCPAVHELAQLQQGVADADGRPLNLLQVE